MILSDQRIRQDVFSQASELSINTYCSENLQPASYDLTLQEGLLKLDDKQGLIKVDKGVRYKQKYNMIVKPREFVLASTVEKVKIPQRMSGRVEGRSSIGRIGLFVENAGWIDPGFEGQITLELYNATDKPIVLKKDMRIAQLILEETYPSASLYEGKYVNQQGATGSKIEDDFDE